MNIGIIGAGTPGSPDTKDPSNPLAAYGTKVVDLGGVVKAFNHLDARVLVEPAVSAGQRVLLALRPAHR